MPYTCKAPHRPTTAYPITKSHDGIERLTLRIDYRVTLREIANYITAYHTTDFVNYEGEVQQSAIDDYLPNKKAAIEIAKDCIHQDGTETPHYRVGDGNLETVRDTVLAKLERLWS